MRRVAGFGFRMGTGVNSLLEALTAAGGPEGVTQIATAEAKADAPCMRDLSERLGLPINAVTVVDLAKPNVVTRSEKSIEIYGTGSLSEAAALHAAGHGARLVAPRTLSTDRMATCAIAESEPERRNP